MKLNNSALIGAAAAVALLIVGLMLLPRPQAPATGPNGGAGQNGRRDGDTSRIIVNQGPGGARSGSSEDAPRPTPTPRVLQSPTPSPTPLPDSDSAEAGATTSTGEFIQGGAPGVLLDAQGNPIDIAAALAADTHQTLPTDIEIAVPVDGGTAMPRTNYFAPRVNNPAVHNPQPGIDPDDITVTPSPVPDPSQPSPTPTPSPRPSPSPTPTPDPGRAGIFLDPASVTVTEGDYFTVNLYVDSPEKAVAGYSTFLLFVPGEIEIAQIREGSDPFLGFPMVAQNRPETGTLILASMHARSMTQPMGRIHLLSIDFEALRPGTVQINLAESDVANSDAQEMIITREGGTRVTVIPVAE